MSFADYKFLFHGAMLNSALYLAAVFVAGTMTHNRLAWTFAIAALGFTYLSYLAAIPRLRSDPRYEFDPMPKIVTPRWQREMQPLLTTVSIACGAVAGIALLF